MNEIAIHPTKKTWAVNTLIVAINGERKVFYPSDKLNDVLSIVAPALKEGKTVQVAILPSDTSWKYWRSRGGKMILDIFIKIVLAVLVVGLCEVCYLIGYSKGLSKGINTMK